VCIYTSLNNIKSENLCLLWFRDIDLIIDSERQVRMLFFLHTRKLCGGTKTRDKRKRHTWFWWGKL